MGLWGLMIFFFLPVYSIMEKLIQWDTSERTALLLWKQSHEDVSVGYLLHVRGELWQKPAQWNVIVFLPVEEVCMCVVTLIWKRSANNHSKMSHSLWSACKNKKPFLSTYLVMCLLASPRGREWGFLWGSQSSCARGRTLAPPSCPPEALQGWACAPAFGRSEPWTCHDRTRGFASTAAEGRRHDRCCPEEANITQTHWVSPHRASETQYRDITLTNYAFITCHAHMGIRYQKDHMNRSGLGSNSHY